MTAPELLAIIDEDVSGTLARIPRPLEFHVDELVDRDLADGKASVRLRAVAEGEVDQPGV